MPNFRRNLAVKVETPGGDNPLLLFFVSPEGTPPFYRGVALTDVALKGKGGTPPYAYSIVSGALPTGLSLNGITGAITGTPSVPGHFTFVARVQDFAANVFLKSFSIDVKSALFVVAGTPRPGEVTLPYSYQFIVADAAGFRLTSGYSVVSGTIPAGLTFHSNGILDGTPTAPDGTSYFTVQATDGTDTIQFAVSVLIYAALEVNVTEAFLGLDNSILELPPIKRNVPYLAHAFRTGGSPRGRFRFVTGDTATGTAAVPVGIKIDSNSGIITGQTSEPTTPPSNEFLVPVLGISFTDSLGGYAESLFHFRIVNAASSTRVSGGTHQYPIDDAGNIQLVSGDGSLSYSVTVDGAIDIRATGIPPGGSGISTINGIGPDSNGNLPIDGIGIDSNGDLFVEGITPGVTYTDTGILITGGAIGGVAIVPNIVSNQVRGMSLGEYDYDSGNWQLWVYPAPINGTVFTLDVWVLGFTGASSAVPTNANSIVASAPPTITGTAGAIVTATGSQATWTASPLQKGSMVTAMPTVNSAAVQWYCLFIPARRTF